jgi:RNA polymerase-binding transcription factor DksA
MGAGRARHQPFSASESHSFDRFSPSKGVAVSASPDRSRVHDLNDRLPLWRARLEEERRILTDQAASTDDDDDVVLLTRGNSLTVRRQHLTDAVRVAGDEAPARVQGSFGRCADCAGALPEERPDARPMAARCAPCQSRSRATGAPQRQPLSTAVGRDGGHLPGRAGSNHAGRNRGRRPARRCRRQSALRTRPNGHRKHDPCRIRPVEPRDPMC